MSAAAELLLSSSDREFWPVTSIFDHDLDSVRMNQFEKYLGQRSLSSKVIVRTRTHAIHCSTWTTEVVDNNVTYGCRRLVWPCCRNRSTSCRCVQAGHYRTSDIVSPAQDSDWTTYRLSPCHDGPLHTTRGSVPSSRHIHSYTRTPARRGVMVRVVNYLRRHLHSGYFYTDLHYIMYIISS